jgi:hypothetical protein
VVGYNSWENIDYPEEFFCVTRKGAVPNVRTMEMRLIKKKYMWLVFHPLACTG